jgi:hypothetical protein
MKHFLLMSLFVVFTTTIHAQSGFLEKGNNAIGLSAGLELQGDIASIIPGVSYTLNGKTDFSLHFQRGSGIDGDDFTIKIIELGAYHQIIKQGGRLPFNWGVGASYGINSISDSYFNELGVTIRGSQYAFSSGISKLINISASTGILPFLKFEYLNQSLTVDDGVDKFSDSDSLIMGSFGLGFSLNLGGNLFIINPQFLFGDRETGYGIHLSYLLMQ